MATPKKKKATKPASKGLGDTIAKVTKWAGIEPCESCKKRQNKLNKLIPYNSVKDQMTQEQFNAWEQWGKEWNGNTLKDDDMTLIEDTYNSIRQTNVSPCRTCGASAWSQLIMAIDSIASKYK